MKQLLHHNYLLVLLIFISFIPLLAFAQPGLPVTHDGQDHVARVANFYQNLSEGIIVPRWAANLNWGYGHPILMFLYPLPSYIASIFHFFGLSLVDSIKLVFFTAFTASGIFMFIWIRQLFGQYAAFAASILYLFAPYRFVNMYVRGALGEHVALVFPPLILYFMHRVSRKSSIWNIIGGSFSFAGLVLSHNAISLMFIPFFILYALYLYLENKKNMRQIFFGIAAIMLFGFSLSCFFWLPALIEGKYTLRYIVTAGGYVNRFVDWQALIYGPWSYGGTGLFTVQMGFINITVMCIAAVAAFLKRTRINILLGFTLAYIFVSVFLMLPVSRFVWNIVPVLQNFQFPWRFLNIPVLCTALMLGYIIFLLPKKLNVYLTFGVVVLIILLNKDYWNANGYLNKPETFYTGIYDGTTDTGESAPIWSVRFMEQKPKQAVEVINGKASILDLKRSTVLHTYIIEAERKSRIRENTLYFPGWKVFIDGQEILPEFQDELNRGLMTFYVDKGVHKIKTVFMDTKLRILANSITVFSFISLVFLFVTRKNKLWQRYL